MFDFEQSLFFTDSDENTEDHVFVAGLARSGTTVLLNAIYSSNQFASLSYENMPFVLAPNFWSKINPAKSHKPAQERAHADGIKVTTDSPEAFEEVFWKTFGAATESAEDNFKRYVTLVLKNADKARYLSKNNQNVRRLAEIRQYFPASKILIPFREPLQQANSLFHQHKKFIRMQEGDQFVRDYMRWIGHSEFGLDYEPIVASELAYPDFDDFNHWLEQWYLTYDAVAKMHISRGEIYPICYETLCRNSELWRQIQTLLDIDPSTKFVFRESRQESLPAFDRALQNKCAEVYESLTNLAYRG